MSTPADVQLSTADLKKLFKQQCEEALPVLLAEYLAEVRTDGELEDKRKALAQMIDVVGWKEPPPKDPNANLPRANIVINLGDGGAPAAITVDMESPTPALVPTAAMLEFADINDEVGLDD